MKKRLVALSLSVVVAAAALEAENRSVDTERSTLTVLVYKSGLLAMFADDHIIRAPIARASMSLEPPLAVEIGVRAAELKVLDPALSADKRAEVQASMLGPDVLNSEKFPDITFTSTAVTPVSADQWTVTGRLTIHGETRSISFPVTRADGRYRGVAVLSQRDFGIEPISIVGGTVRVKDQVKVEFDIVPQR